MIFNWKPGRRLRHAAAVVAVVTGLAACGGGTSQYEPFVAERLIVFGDETSVLETDGSKYTVNAVTSTDNGDGTTTDVVDCSANPLWVQSLASVYGFVFEQCNPTQLQTPKAFMRAAAGAKVADIRTQIDEQLANGGFRDKDLTTVLAGVNDILELYAEYPARPEPDLIAEAGARGKLLAQQVNLLVDLGAKVIVSTLPDVGLTPFALRERTTNQDIDRAALMSRLTAAFNEQLGVNIVLDGRYVGLVQADLRTQAMARSPGSFGLANVTAAACQDTSPPPLCTVHTLVDGATAGSWMWAGDTTLGYPGQQALAVLAIDRARRNPF